MNFAVMHPQALDVQQKTCACIALMTKDLQFYFYMLVPVNLFVFERRVMYLLWLYRGEIEAQVLQLIQYCMAS